MKICQYFLFVACCILFTIISIAQTTYYVSVKGNDSNDGKSTNTAWQTLQKINATTFKPGDKILFEATNIFNGSLLINNSGELNKPILYASYGEGRSIIKPTTDDAIKGYNVSNIQIKDLVVQGSGVANNKSNGIHFYSDDTVSNPQNITVENCDASGFHNIGIAVGCGDNEKIKGYKNIRIIKCNAFENGQAGISSYGSYTGFQNSNFYISQCKAYNNRGIPGKTENHSGNGIVMGEVDSLLIEHCEAYENGADNSSEAGGPIGIWVWMCKNATIQHCVSHDNHAGLTKDGGGFDIDGGSSNCIMQYNYSYNNEGAGYLLAEYGALFPFTDNIIRFNISENDGRKNNYGGIGIWGASADYKVTNCYVYNNTIYSNDKNVVNGTPAAITLMGPHFSNVIVVNNIFALTGNINFINADENFSKKQLYLLHNNYYSYTNTDQFKFGKLILKTMSDFNDSNREQEILNGQIVEMKVNPLFVSDKKYELQNQSLLRKKAFHVFKYVQGEKTNFDYYGNTLPSNAMIIPGACIK